MLRRVTFVPDDFVVPLELTTPRFRLIPLRPEHNAADYAAWQSSIEHIAATPGFAGRPWPTAEMTLEQNLGDLVEHDEDFAARRGFTYTVTEPATGATIGCVYIYPSDDADLDAAVRSWVTADHAELDQPVYAAVTDWLARDWPFARVSYAAR